MTLRQQKPVTVASDGGKRRPYKVDSRVSLTLRLLGIPCPKPVYLIPGPGERTEGVGCILAAIRKGEKEIPMSSVEGGHKKVHLSLSRALRRRGSAGFRKERTR